MFVTYYDCHKFIHFMMALSIDFKSNRASFHASSLSRCCFWTHLIRESLLNHEDVNSRFYCCCHSLYYLCVFQKKFSFSVLKKCLLQILKTFWALLENVENCSSKIILEPFFVSCCSGSNYSFFSQVFCWTFTIVHHSHCYWYSAINSLDFISIL